MTEKSISLSELRSPVTQEGGRLREERGRMCVDSSLKKEERSHSTLLLLLLLIRSRKGYGQASEAEPLHQRSRILKVMSSIVKRTYQVVVAATNDMGIGKDGKLPWNLPSDLRFFKEITATASSERMNAVVMGRKTWESIPTKYRPLPGRFNVVLTTRGGSYDIAKSENVVACGSLSTALNLLAESSNSSSIERVFVIGGGQVLREALNAPECEAIHLTKVESKIECDTFIPPIDLSAFQPWYSSSTLVENGVSFRFMTYVRVNRFVIGNSEDKDLSFLPKMILERKIRSMDI